MEKLLTSSHFLANSCAVTVPSPAINPFKLNGFDWSTFIRRTNPFSILGELGGIFLLSYILMEVILLYPIALVPHRPRIIKN